MPSAAGGQSERLADHLPPSRWRGTDHDAHSTSVAPHPPEHARRGRIDRTPIGRGSLPEPGCSPNLDRERSKD